ncbi:MAG: Fibronectin, type domain protein, partial [Deltaproteobacteria bacterium]|nr:Fibronectin, type domain protein [Deltaproteobacteria bacterium]
MKTVKVTRLLAVAIAAAVLTTYGCPGPDDSGTSGGGVGVALTSIAVSPANPGIAIGTTQQFTATGTYSDSTTQDITTTVTWNSSATSVATISSAGLTTATGAGITTIKATSGNVSGATTLTVNPAVNIPKTGQATSYDANNPKKDDGALQRGVAWPSPRFTVDGTGLCVTDNLTGLMWVKTRDGTMRTWQQALDYANNLTLCGYTDWRLPNRKELRSLIDYSQSTPALPSGHPFGGGTGYWWSSSTYTTDTNYAWVVKAWNGDDTVSNKTVIQLAENAWPVRAGQQDTPNPAYPANLPKTGQTTSYATGDDGNLKMGVAWPSLRFTDNG